MQDKVAKGRDLAEILIVPEPFKVEDKDRIANERKVRLRTIAAGPTGKRKLMILVGEFKKFEDGVTGKLLMIKHMPGFPFQMDGKLADSFKKTFGGELALLDADPMNSHLMIIATFSFTEIGVAVIKKMGCMVVSENWLPYANSYEKDVLDHLKNRRFDINLCFNQKHDAVRPYVVLKDAHPNAYALYIIPDSAKDQYVEAVEAQSARSPLLSWCWQPSVEPKIKGIADLCFRGEEKAGARAVAGRQGGDDQHNSHLKKSFSYSLLLRVRCRTHFFVRPSSSRTSSQSCPADFLEEFTS